MALPNVNGPNRGNEEQQLKARIKLWIREELAAAAAGGIGLHVDGATGNLIIDKGQEQSGNYVAGTSGWALFPTGNAEFNSLTLRGGIIGNDALANPVGASAYNGTGGYVSVPLTTWTTIVTQTVTVPTGFSKAIVIANSAATFNGTITNGLFGSQTVINGVGGPQTYESGSGYSLSASTQLLSGLTGGGTFTVAESVYVAGSGTYTASGTVQGAVIWLR